MMEGPCDVREMRRVAQIPQPESCCTRLVSASTPAESWTSLDRTGRRDRAECSRMVTVGVVDGSESVRRESPPLYAPRHPPGWQLASSASDIGRWLAGGWCDGTEVKVMNAELSRVGL